MPATVDVLDSNRLSEVIGRGLAVLPRPQDATEPVFVEPISFLGRTGRVRGYACLAWGAVVRLRIEWARLKGPGWSRGSTFDVPAERVPALLAGLGAAGQACAVIEALWAPKGGPS